MKLISSDYQRGLDRFKDFFGDELTLPRVISETKEYLAEKFGVENLSISEGVRLRHCVEESLELFDNEFRKSPEEHGELINFWKEASFRWLSRTYLLSQDLLHRESFKTKGVDWEFKEWLRIEREKSHLL